MKWILASERLPDKTKDDMVRIIFRSISTANVMAVFPALTPNIAAMLGDKLNKYEWLDETIKTPSPVSYDVKELIADFQRLFEYVDSLNDYLKDGINYHANTIKKADERDLQQLASDSFFTGARWMRDYLLLKCPAVERLSSLFIMSIISRGDLELVDGDWYWKDDRDGGLPLSHEEVIKILNL